MVAAAMILVVWITVKFNFAIETIGSVFFTTGAIWEAQNQGRNSQETTWGKSKGTGEVHQD